MSIDIFRVINALPQSLQQRATILIQNRDEEQAKQALSFFYENLYPTSILRYRPVEPNSRDRLIQAIFDLAIKTNPRQVMQAVENGTYPLLKRVAWIKIPKTLGSILNNPFFKIAVSVYVLFFSISKGYRAYAAVEKFAIVQMFPFILHKTPLPIIRLFNRAMDLIKIIYERRFEIIIGSCIVKYAILRLPRIPYITALVQRFDLIKIFWAVFFQAPQDAAQTIWIYAWKIALFGWHTCHDMSLLLKGVVERTEAERVAYYKQHAHILWRQSLVDRGLI